MKSLAAAVCLVTSGCAGVPAQPSWPRDCPPETLAAMASRGMKPGDQGEFQLHIHDQGEAQDFVNAQPGPLVSFIGSEWDALRWFPLGTKLYGFMWMGGQDIQAYWTEAHLPDGQKVPVCLVLGYDERGGYSKEFEGTQPGTSRIPKRAPITVTRRFERPE